MLVRPVSIEGFCTASKVYPCLPDISSTCRNRTFRLRHQIHLFAVGNRSKRDSVIVGGNDDKKKVQDLVAGESFLPCATSFQLPFRLVRFLFRIFCGYCRCFRLRRAITFFLHCAPIRCPGMYTIFYYYFLQCSYCLVTSALIGFILIHTR